MTELFEDFQEFRRILCVCPCCGDLVRVSELRLKVKGPSPDTWLDDHEKKNRIIEEKEGKFAEIEDKLRKLAREKGRKEAEKVFNKAICPSFKSLKYNPLDVKPILNPIDFIVFKGMSEKSINEIIMLSKECNNELLNAIREQVKTAITEKKYEWQVARIGETGNILFE